jgi:ATP-dependent RNA helicase SUPV3L1/SUV3
MVARADIAVSLDGLDGVARKAFRGAGVTIGALDVFDARVLKPAPARWRRVLRAARAGAAVEAGPRDGASVLERGAPGATLDHGYRPVAAQAVRIDLVERIARAAHDARGASGRKPFALDSGLALSMGLTRPTLERLMAGFGFRPAPGSDTAALWTWRGLPTVRATPPPRDTAMAGAFAALADLAV